MKKLAEGKKNNDLEESSGFIEGIQNIGKDIWGDNDKDKSMQ